MPHSTIFISSTQPAIPAAGLLRPAGPPDLRISFFV